ncbi:MAG: hypothetical protein ACC682_15110 [Gemmatimonadota bacterium]
MNWEALGAIGEIIGAAGVIVSLLYLAGQVRRSSRQDRHASAQAVLDKLNGLIGQLAFVPGAGDVWSRGLSGLEALNDDEELVRFSSMLMQAFRAYEEVFHSRKAGVIEDWAWLHARAPIDHMMRTPGFQQWWKLRSDWFGEEFQVFLEERMPEATGSLADDFKRVIQEGNNT